MSYQAKMEEEWILEDESVEKKRRASHIRACCVDGCRSKGYRLLIEGERVQYFPFPLYDKDLCQRWSAAVKLSRDAPYEKSFVCSKHFRFSDYKARLHDDSKKTLRRTAIPSLEPVVYAGKMYKKKDPDDYSTSSDDAAEDDADEEEEHNGKVFTSLVSKEAADGEDLSVWVVKDKADELDEAEKPKFLTEHKKVPVLLQNLLALGAPYPWRKQGLESWTNERLSAHEDQLEKLRTASTEEIERISYLQEQIEARKEILALAIIKKSTGRMVLSNFLKTLN